MLTIPELEQHQKKHKRDKEVHPYRIHVPHTATGFILETQKARAEEEVLDGSPEGAFEVSEVIEEVAE
jgi:hypothetical protein